jgi:propionate CoA-transferase
MNASLHIKRRKPKVVSAEEAVSRIPNGVTLATSGFVGIGFPEEIAIALENRFLETASPRDLKLVFSAGQGDGAVRGLNRISHAGLLSQVIGGHWGLIPRLSRLAMSNQIDAYNLPLGIISCLYREIAAGRPGLLSKVGLGTFVDPRLEGAKLNSRTREDLVELLSVGGEEHLFYRSFPIHVAMIRGTCADANGNVSMEKEALTVDSLSLAMAARNSGGIVIVQVEEVLEGKGIPSRQVKIPGVLVDYIVRSKPDNHWQTFNTYFDPVLSGQMSAKISESNRTAIKPSRRSIARRAALELHAGAVVNIGIGIPEGLSDVLVQEGVSDEVTLTTEAGVIGGQLMGGLDFGSAINPHAVLDQPYQFDFYDGGGLDIAFLGLAQVDAKGNVNVSKFAGRLAGAGGFINISQNARTVVFMGTFAAESKDSIQDSQKGSLIEPSNLCPEASVTIKSGKFVPKVEQVTFSAAQAINNRQKVLYITERCVFDLCADGLRLIEIRAGLDLQLDILDCMSFTPQIAPSLLVTPSAVHDGSSLGLQQQFLKDRHHE